MDKVKDFNYKTGKAHVALKLDGYYVWDSSVIKANGKYYMFASRWKEELGFGWNWLFNSEICRFVADSPNGEFKFDGVVLPRRGRQYFDGMNTHNTCIKYWNGKYYLYYMGTTYGGDIPNDYRHIKEFYALETWNRKRIGVAVADKIDGEFVRRDEPLLAPRDCSHWDCTITTNPSVVVLPSGKTYMIYKSRRAYGKPLQLGIAVADKPDGKFERLTENPILEFESADKHIEDPFLWYDDGRKKFCMIAKDDSKNGDSGITGEWGAGFYAESDDCVHFEIAKNPKVYSRNLEWSDGEKTTQCNLERPSILFDENGEPMYLYCASGYGERPYAFKGATYVAGIALEKK